MFDKYLEYEATNSLILLNGCKNFQQTEKKKGC